jgi:3-hydroxyisobutyrate dehydrogenase
MADKPSVGFVGVGNMGWPMAACLVKAGFTVHVNDSRREVANNFAQQVGGDAPDTLRQLAATSDVVITMLPTSTIVEQVLANGDDNVMAGMKPGTVVIEMSSGVPSVTQVLAERVMQLGGYMIDAPVSGGVPRAKTGELAIMVGGDSAIIDSVLPVLSAMGTSVLRTGAVGSGQAMKALNNLVSAGGFMIGIEALLIGQRFGLDPAVMVDVLNAATGMSNSSCRGNSTPASLWGFWQRICRSHCRWDARPELPPRCPRCARKWWPPRRRCSAPMPITPKWLNFLRGWSGLNSEKADTRISYPA